MYNALSVNENLNDNFIISVDHLPYHYQIRGIEGKKIVKMFQKFLGIYTLHSQSVSDSGPVYIQSMLEQEFESETLEHIEKGDEHFLSLAITNGSFVWAITPELPKTGSGFRSQVTLPVCANATNQKTPPSKGWYTGNIFGGWKSELNIEVIPKGGKKHFRIDNKIIDHSCSGLCMG